MAPGVTKSATARMSLRRQGLIQWSTKSHKAGPYARRSFADLKACVVRSKGAEAAVFPLQNKGVLSQRGD